MPRHPTRASRRRHLRLRCGPGPTWRSPRARSESGIWPCSTRARAMSCTSPPSTRRPGPPCGAGWRPSPAREPAFPCDVTILDDKWVAYFEPVERSLGEAFLVLLDPAGAGTELARSDKKLFLSFPSECDDDPSSACVRAWTRSSRHARFKLSKGGQALELPGDGRTRTGRRSADMGSCDTPQRVGRSHVGVEKDGVMVWSKPEAELFGARYSTDGGWRFRYSEATNAFIGTVGLSPGHRQEPDSGPDGHLPCDGRPGRVHRSGAVVPGGGRHVLRRRRHRPGQRRRRPAPGL